MHWMIEELIGVNFKIRYFRRSFRRDYYPQIKIFLAELSIVENNHIENSSS